MTGVLAVNAYQGVMIAIFVGFLAAILALGKWSTRSAADYLDWKPTRSPAVDAQNEVDDIAQMLAATNARRRRRGLPERTAGDVAESVRRDRAEMDRRACELDQDRQWRAS